MRKRNSELVHADPLLLQQHERVRQHHLRKFNTIVPCPLCLLPLNKFEAGGYDIDEEEYPNIFVRLFKCPQCFAELDLIEPVRYRSPGWRWAISGAWARRALLNGEADAITRKATAIRPGNT